MSVFHWSEGLFFENHTFRVDETLDSPTTRGKRCEINWFYQWKSKMQSFRLFPLPAGSLPPNKRQCFSLEWMLFLNESYVSRRRNTRFSNNKGKRSKINWFYQCKLKMQVFVYFLPPRAPPHPKQKRVFFIGANVFFNKSYVDLVIYVLIGCYIIIKTTLFI